MDQPAGTWSVDLKIPSQRGAGKAFLNTISLRSCITRIGPRPTFFGIHLSVEAAIVSAIRHGNELDPKETGSH